MADISKRHSPNPAAKRKDGEWPRTCSNRPFVPCVPAPAVNAPPSPHRSPPTVDRGFAWPVFGWNSAIEQHSQTRDRGQKGGILYVPSFSSGMIVQAFSSAVSIAGKAKRPPNGSSVHHPPDENLFGTARQETRLQTRLALRSFPPAATYSIYHKACLWMGPGLRVRVRVRARTRRQHCF